MILVDSSVWIDFFHGGRRATRLTALLENNEVLMHGWILGELALGTLNKDRDLVLADLQRLPPAPLVADDEILDLIEARDLHGKRIGWVDAHLLGSVLVSGAALWTLARRLSAVAEQQGVGLR